jgi:hypothetical protein
LRSGNRKAQVSARQPGASTDRNILGSILGFSLASTHRGFGHD